MRQNVNIAEMSEDEKRGYDRDRQAEYRRRKREAVKAGAATPNEELTRDLLADIAIAMIATSAPGSETITAALGKYFQAQGAGWSLQIIRKARAGKYRMKVLARGE